MAKKIVHQKASNILLSSTSARRKNAWNRLRNVGSSRGLTQDQITKYLEAQLKKQYQNAPKEGALTHDKVDRYLAHLAKLASGTLAKGVMDQKKVTEFSEKIDPVIKDIAQKDALTASDIENHTKQVSHLAVKHAQESVQPKPPAPVPEDDELEIELLEDESESEGGQVPDAIPQPLETPAPAIDASNNPDKPEIIPIGLEQGAPKIPLSEFLKFPLAKDELKPDEGSRFNSHKRYLEMAVKNGCLEQELYEEAVEAFSTAEAIEYSRYFDIFPENDFEDAKLMMVYSQWRKNTLQQFVIEKE